MDWGSLIGLIVALSGIVLGQVLEGGRLGSLVQPAAFTIVIFGTFGAVLLQSGIPNFVLAIKMVKLVFTTQPDDLLEVSKQINVWSMTARREGLLSLERYINTASDPFIEKGLRLTVDGIDPFKVREILELEISTYERTQKLAAKVWDSAGGYAPTIGILGAVMGLIHVMENLSEPSRLGTGIAVAFVATIYGVGFANLIFIPIANKLKLIISDNIARMEMLTDAFAGIAAGDHPRVVEERLDVYRH